MKWNEIRLRSNPTTRSPPTVPLPAIKITSGTKAFFISFPANVSYFSWNCRNEICTENISACKLAMTDWKSFNHANCLSVVGGYRKRFEGTLRHMIPMCSASTSFPTAAAEIRRNFPAKQSHLGAATGKACKTKMRCLRGFLEKQEEHSLLVKNWDHGIKLMMTEAEEEKSLKTTFSMFFFLLTPPALFFNESFFGTLVLFVSVS